MAEAIFINIVESISASRCWLFPLLTVCTLVLLADELKGAINGK